MTDKMGTYTSDPDGLTDCQDCSLDPEWCDEYVSPNPAVFGVCHFNRVNLFADQNIKIVQLDSRTNFQPMHCINTCNPKGSHK